MKLFDATVKFEKSFLQTSGDIRRISEALLIVSETEDDVRRQIEEYYPELKKIGGKARVRERGPIGKAYAFFEAQFYSYELEWKAQSEGGG